MKKFALWDLTGKQSVIEADTGEVTKTAKGLKVVFKAGKKIIRPRGFFVGFTEISPPIKFIQVPDNDEDSLGGGKRDDE